MVRVHSPEPMLIFEVVRDRELKVAYVNRLDCGARDCNQCIGRFICFTQKTGYFMGEKGLIMEEEQARRLRHHPSIEVNMFYDGQRHAVGKKWDGDNYVPEFE